MTTPSPPPDRVGSVVGDRYAIRALLGEGGMARVYAAYDQKHDRQVAIKMLRAELTAALGVDRFLREIRIAARLTHPHVLSLYDSGEDQGALYYVMPLVEGESLRQRLARQGPLPLEEAVRIAQQVADALSYAHEQGFVHRDIKPDNIMLARGHALVADFGIARVVSGAGDLSLTTTGLSLGTPLYMSPEQALGDPGLDYHTDIYSLGCVTFEMLTGRPPFIADNPTALLARHISAALPELPAEVPSAVATAVTRALAKQPSDRFPSAVAFASALTAGGELPAAPSGPHPGSARGTPLWWKHGLVLVLLLLLAVFFVTGVRAVRHLSDTESGVPEEAAVAPQWTGNWTQSVPVVALGDTAIGLQLGPVLILFNGRGWTRILLPYDPSTLAVIGNEVWAFDAEVAAREQRLTPTGWVAGDNVPVRVGAVWHGGGAMVVANSQGEVAERSNRGWRQLPSGRQTPIVKLFGPSQDAVMGIGVFAVGDPGTDSLIRRQGSFWESIDPEGRRGEGWIYQDGATLENGASIVVGYQQTGRDRQAPLVLRQERGSQRWNRVATGSTIPQHRLDHILPLAGNEALAWSDGEPGLVEILGDHFTPVEIPGKGGVRAVALLGEAPVVLTDAGSLMIRRGDTFDVYGEVPLRPRAGTGDLTHGELLALTSLLGNSPFLAVARALRSGGRAWMLTEAGTVYSARCQSGRCAARLEVNGASRAVSDMANAGERVIVVGGSGLVQQWDSQRWTRPAWASGIRDELAMVSLAENGATIIAGREAAYLHGPGSAGFRTLLYEGRGVPSAVAASADSGAAILWDNYMMNVDWNGAYRKGTARRGPPISSARYTCDGRLMTVSATPGDPLLGGEVSSGFATRSASLEFGVLPIPLDLSDITIDARGTIRLLGRGGVWVTLPSLRHAGIACADTTTARQNVSGFEGVEPDW